MRTVLYIPRRPTLLKARRLKRHSLCLKPLICFSQSIWQWPYRPTPTRPWFQPFSKTHYPNWPKTAKFKRFTIEARPKAARSWLSPNKCLLQHPRNKGARPSHGTSTPKSSENQVKSTPMVRLFKRARLSWTQLKLSLSKKFYRPKPNNHSTRKLSWGLQKIKFRLFWPSSISYRPTNSTISP